jgi:hypothetical protein
MINFLKLQYQMGKITDEQLDRLVALGRISENDIMVIKGVEQ